MRHAIAQNAMALYAIRLAETVLPLLTFPYVAHVLGIEKLGLISWAQAFVGYFVTVTEYGFNFTATREVAIHRENPERVCQIYSATMVARLILALLCFVVMSAIVFAVPAMRRQSTLFNICFFSVVGTALFPQWLFQGLEKMSLIAVREVGARFIGLMTIFILVRNSGDYLWAAAIMSGSTAIAGLVGLFYVTKLTGVRFTGTSVAEVRGAFVEGWSVFLSTAAITLYGRSNTFILGLKATDADVGAYTSALRLVDAAKSLVFPISTAIFPHISRLSADSREQALLFIRKVASRMMALFGLVSLIFLIGAPLLIHVFFGNRFDPAIPMMRIMSPIPFLVAGSGCFGIYYMLGFGYKKQWSQMIVTAGLFNFVVLVPLSFLTAPANAVAITGTVVEAFVLAWSYAFYRVKRS